ncbi:uncharacterized protein ASCRUDRAFT_10762 [Ascoidea rubescens DSM 1968]|uniref:Uncharacterized protein n=1 Tax=Ascoidea rubescens DSM 1968 TaxID=1344418 RepID=A0A1D2V7Z9_9ASCO|nr:hypothetical protein ASCRUDRAFT_10762 [Ascoidea rubescens DSM 1968]ODV57791.1 hypothetical protein ASCRUDRAFT_10762 [Ascoidea rubescens DSM 1968]
MELLKSRVIRATSICGINDFVGNHEYNNCISAAKEMLFAILVLSFDDIIIKPALDVAFIN